MYKQLRDWLIYGILSDKYSEFYIFNLNTKISDSVELETTVRNQDDELGIGGFTVSQLNEVEELISGGKFCSKYSLHDVDSTMVPKYLTIPTAKKILPGESSHRKLKWLVKQHQSAHYRVCVEIHLKDRHFKSAGLGPQGPRLGLTTWLTDPSPTQGKRVGASKVLSPSRFWLTDQPMDPHGIKA